ncbi:MAG: glycoside hydrolase, partial [Bacillota bacterium]|nr:glycoside hydrolase [Bacillota bacterium]
MREILVNGYAYPYIEEEALENWLGTLSYVSAFSYGITPEGGLIPLEDRALVETARSRGVAALMVVAPMNAEGAFSNELAKSLLEDPAARSALIEN